MRSIFISLILFCSLTQFAIADTTPEPKTKGCGTVYYCYVPEICTDVNLASKPLSGYGVKELKEDSHVNDDCPAFIRYHLYTNIWINVTIESFQPKESIKSVNFLHEISKPDSSGLTGEEFSCGIVKHEQIETLVGGYKYSTDTNTEKFRKSPPPSKVKCNFDFKTNVNKKIFTKAGSLHRLYFSITFVDQPETKETDKNIEMEPKANEKCDPSLFKFKKESNKTQLHIPVEYEPGNYYCADPRYKMQFKSTATGSYELVENLECDLSLLEFKINGIKMIGPIEIRCVADSKFFCKYNAMPFVSQDPHKKAVIGPDMDTSKESEMKCPAGMPNLIVARESKPVMNAKFECHHFGNNELWVVDTHHIFKEEPEIYCTDNVKCHDIENNVIPESSVVNGYLRPTDFTPACLNDGTSDGTLFVEDKGVPREQVMSTRCDGLTGEFKYAIKSGEFVIGKETKFECTYPVYTDTAKDEKNEQKLRTGSLAAGGVAIALIVGIIGIGCFVVRKKKIQERKKMAKTNHEAWFYYCADDNEAEKNNMKPRVKEKGALDKGPGSGMKWNEMILSFCSDATNQQLEIAEGIFHSEGKSYSIKDNKTEVLKENASFAQMQKDLNGKFTKAKNAHINDDKKHILKHYENNKASKQAEKDQSKSKSEKKQ